jgi:hypothetical protein
VLYEDTTPPPNSHRFYSNLAGSANRNQTLDTIKRCFGARVQWVC